MIPCSECVRPFLAHSWLAAALLSLVAATAMAVELPAYAPDATAARSAVPAVYHWDLSPLCADDAAFEDARSSLLAGLPTLASFEGRLAEPAALATCLELYFRLHRQANVVTLYANLRQATALSDDHAGAMVQSSLAAMDELAQRAAFIRREVLAMEPATLEAALAAEPALATFHPYLVNLRRRADRLLSPDAERALALLGDNLWAEIDLNEIPSALEDAFGSLLTDIPWPTIRDRQGQEVQLTLANYGLYRQSPDRAVRRATVSALMATLRQYQHALAATLAGQVKLDIGYARARGYATALEAYLDKDDLELAVYDNLVGTVNAHLPLLHRYVELRKKALGLPDLHLYDLYVPLVPSADTEVPFADAHTAILAALEPLGPAYGAILAEGLDPANGWLDLYPHQGKRSGAFSSSTHGPHPWVLMNYQNSLDDMSTLAHEYGHALHSHLAMRDQPYSSFRYPPFLAEVASTCIEALLNDYLVARASDPAERAYLLANRLEDIRTTIFRQTMFAEFERALHGLAEAGTPLTASLIEATYREIVTRYYGPGYTVDPDDGLEWAYIPHFYYKFYVYSYATGMASGIAIADRVREHGEPAAAAYLGMLSAGCSEPPLVLLGRAGVDLTTAAPIEAAMDAFEHTLDEVERLLATR